MTVDRFWHLPDLRVSLNVRFGWRVQLIAATHSANFSAGV